MRPKSIVVLLLVNLVLLTVMPAYAYENVWWNDNWSYRQEVTIPIDTSIGVAKYQPIDIFMEFNNPCWAKNEREHSIRVLFQDEENLYELEYVDEENFESIFVLITKLNSRKKLYELISLYKEVIKNSDIRIKNHCFDCSDLTPWFIIQNNPKGIELVNLANSFKQYFLRFISCYIFLLILCRFFF